MPENEKDMHTQADVPVETALEKFERERLTRRAALRKIGYTSALSVFALFSVDDLARMVGREMERRRGDSKVAGAVAEELRQAGVAMAGSPSSTPCTGSCEGCCTQHATDKDNCATQYTNCVGIERQTDRYCQTYVYIPCMNTADATFSACWTNNNCGDCSC